LEKKNLKKKSSPLSHCCRWRKKKINFDKKRNKLTSAAVGGHCDAMSSLVVAAWGAAGDEAEYASSSLSLCAFVRQKINKK
jgi:hypothetical protein